jgi:hypothetical protein
MSEQPQDESTYGLVMPFVTCKSRGGPHDDASYVAGYEMGVLNRDLALTRFLGTLPGVKQIHAENVPQADLIAMRNSYSMEVIPYEDCPDYVELKFMPTERGETR